VVLPESKAQVALAGTFEFQFDNDSTPGIQPPIIGTGTFTFANDLADGTHPFVDIGAFSLSFTGELLGFEPSYVGQGLRLFRELGRYDYFGDYIATASVPESGSTMSLFSIAVLGFGMTQFRKVTTAASRRSEMFCPRQLGA
jgi:hypothetical protein